MQTEHMYNNLIIKYLQNTVGGKIKIVGEQ